MARPQKKIADKRTARFPTTQCTDGELATLRSRAAQAGMSVTEYIRHRGLYDGDIIIHQQSGIELALVQYLKLHVGDWLNKLTHRANATGIFPSGLKDCLAALKPVLAHINFSVKMYDYCADVKTKTALLEPSLVEQLQRISTNLFQLSRIPETPDNIKLPEISNYHKMVEALLDRVYGQTDL